MQIKYTLLTNTKITEQFLDVYSFVLNKMAADDIII